MRIIIPALGYHQPIIQIITNKLRNLSSCFNAFNNDALCIVNNSGNIPQLFNNVTIKMQAGGPCNLLLSNFNMTYDTNNYTLTNTNRATGPIGVQNIQYVDLNQDGFYTGL